MMETVCNLANILSAKALLNPMSLMNQFLTPSDPRVNLRQWKRTQTSFKHKLERESQIRSEEAPISVQLHLWTLDNI